ncbi:hypothetical protein GGX14DRAFT_392880, partial [Mycena pura]
MSPKLCITAIPPPWGNDAIDTSGGFRAQPRTSALMKHGSQACQSDDSRRLSEIWCKQRAFCYAHCKPNSEAIRLKVDAFESVLKAQSYWSRRPKPNSQQPHHRCKTQALKTKRASNAATQSHQTPAKDSTVVLKNPKDKNDGKPKGKNLIRNVSLTEVKDRVGAAIVSILNTKETFHKRVNLDLPEDAGATITVAVARKGPGVKPPFRSAMGSTPHARARDNDDFESDFAPLEPIPLKEVESLAVGEAQFPPFSCLNCILARVDCQPFGYGVQCSRCQTKRSKNCEHTLSAMELSNLFATIAKQNTFSLEMTKYVIDDLKTSIARAKRDYDSLRLSIAAVEHSVCRTIEHARAATDVLGTDGLLSYFEAPKSSQDPDAIDLLNRLIENFNSMKAAPGDSIAS